MERVITFQVAVIPDNYEGIYFDKCNNCQPLMFYNFIDYLCSDKQSSLVLRHLNQWYLGNDLIKNVCYIKDGTFECVVKLDDVENINQFIDSIETLLWKQYDNTISIDQDNYCLNFILYSEKRSENPKLHSYITNTYEDIEY
jgi:hypothetical protein